MATNQQIKKPTLPLGAKRLTWKEQKEIRDKGLCFNCDEFYKPGHLCVKPRLLVLEMAPDSTDSEANFVDTDIQHECSENFVEQNDQEPTISLHSLMGSTFPNTMRITSYVKAKPITILVDSGATHNFIHPSIVKNCGHKIETDNSLRVTVGDGGTLDTHGSCYNIPVTLNNCTFLVYFHLLEISGCDAVSGVQWLRYVGKISWDFNKLTMKFKFNGVDIILRGNTSSVMLMDVSPMQRLLCRETYGFTLQLCSLHTATTNTLVVPPMI